MDNIIASWCLSLNYGDRLTDYLIRKITKKPPIYISMDVKKEKVIGPGSILNWCDEYCKAWTCGIANANDKINPKTKIYSVRGPITRNRALMCGANCPPIFGDAGLLMPMFFMPTESVKYSVGVIPHWYDQYDTMDFIEKKGFKFINVFDSIENFIADICSCEKILSSALHGIITADAYGVPANRLIVTDKIGGDGTKFHDHDLYVLGQKRNTWNVKDLMARNPEEIKKMIEVKKPVFDMEAILKARPF